MMLFRRSYHHDRGADVEGLVGHPKSEVTLSHGLVLQKMPAEPLPGWTRNVIAHRNLRRILRQHRQHDRPLPVVLQRGHYAFRGY